MLWLAMGNCSCSSSLTLSKTSTRSSPPNSPFLNLLPEFSFSDAIFARSSLCRSIISSRITSSLRRIILSLSFVQLSALRILDDGNKSAISNPPAIFSVSSISLINPSLSLHTPPNAARHVMELEKEKIFSVRLTELPEDSFKEPTKRAASSLLMDWKRRTILGLRRSLIQIFLIWRQ